MEEKLSLVLSVHQLVDFLLREGDIDDRVYNAETMAMGSVLHSAFQKKQGNEYLSEVALSCVFKRELGTISLQGRADGIILTDEGPIIDEIKSTVEDLASFHKVQKNWHIGQAACYALMYLNQHGGDKAKIRLTYLSQTNDDKLIKEYSFTKEEFQEKVFGYCDDYLSFMIRHYRHQKEVEESAKTLQFPYPVFRKGQRELAKYAFGVASKRGVFFAEAPTGIGKTMSTLFPTIKAFKRKKLDKIFYLTAKTTGALMAYSAITELREKGFKGIDSLLVAKDKLCVNPGKGCNPDECLFAKNYYGKIKGVIDEAINDGARFDNLYVTKLAHKHKICPFELQLDLSLFADIVIGDYNYFLDPIVKLDRYFGDMADPSTYFVLLDEAHNLIDRSRDCYSAVICTDSIDYAKKEVKGPKAASLRRVLGKLENELIENYIGENGYGELDEVPESLNKVIESFKRACKEAKKDGQTTTGSAFKKVSRNVNRFYRIQNEFFREGYKVITYHEGGIFGIKLYCIDPSYYINKSFEEARGVTCFSATLSPIKYYMNAITGKEDHPFLLLPSPFPKENVKILLAPNVSVRYKDREKSYGEVARYLSNFVKCKAGNYFLFFPSYGYLESIRPLLDLPKASIFPQDKNMTPEERVDFLLNFPAHPEGTNVGLLVLGGPFSEGIDLPHDRLIGVGIVGVGMPQIGFDNDLIRDYYEEKNGKGFDYAYQNPGINKVMQAVGRLIRSESDVGAAILIDDRYLQREYKDVIKRAYNDYYVVYDPEEVKEPLEAFWKNKE